VEISNSNKDRLLKKLLIAQVRYAVNNHSLLLRLVSKIPEDEELLRLCEKGTESTKALMSALEAYFE